MPHITLNDHIYLRHIYTYKYTYIRMYIYIYIYICTDIDTDRDIGIDTAIEYGSRHRYLHACMSMHSFMHACIHAYLGPPGRPAPSGPAQPERTHANQREENDPSQCFFTGAENRIRAGTGAPFARRKEQHHILYGARNDDITANKRQQPYHISVENTAPHRQGGANQN